MIIKIEGADQALKALRQLEPETARKVGRKVSDLGSELATAIRISAPADPPMRGWKQTNGLRGSRGGAGWPGWTQIQASSRRRGMSAIVTTISDPAVIAVMYESAGIKGGKTKAGRQMIANLNRESQLVQSGKHSGRLGRRVVKEHYPAIMEGLREAAEEAVDAVNRLMP